MELVQLEYGRQADFGELHVDVPSGVQTKNDSVTVDGQVRFFKDGSGTLVMGKTAQSYWSTTVNAGLVKLVAGNSAERIGRDGAEITVAQGATLDLAGAYGMIYYSFYLNGGTLENSVTIVGSSEMSLIQNIHLGADSTIAFDAHGLSSKGFASGVMDRAFMPTVLDLNGHVLTANAYSASYLNNTYVTSGTLKLLGTWVIHDNYPFTAPDARVEVHGVFSPHATTTLGEYVDYTTVTSLDFSGPLTVTKLFMPNTDYFYGGTLNDGVVIDLSGRSTAWNVDSKLGGKTTQKTAKFVDGGHYTINVAGRSLKSGEQLLTWDVGRKPSNFDTLVFELDEVSRRRGFHIIVKGNGLYVNRGMAILVR